MSVANVSRPLPRRDRRGSLFEKLTLFLSETLFMGAWNPWENRTCCWVVICKNKKAHREANIMFGHKILLGETDSFEPVPVSGPFLVQCDECGEEQSYVPDEVLRLEVELPESFTPHPRFR